MVLCVWLGVGHVERGAYYKLWSVLGVLGVFYWSVRWVLGLYEVCLVC